MNTTFRTPKRVTAGKAVIKTRGRSKEPEVARYAQVIKLLRPSGTSLLSAVTHYAQAVKILGGDKIVEAAKDFARKNQPLRKRRKVRKPHASRRGRTVRKARRSRKLRMIRKPRKSRKLQAVRKPQTSRKLRKVRKSHTSHKRHTIRRLRTVRKSRPASKLRAVQQPAIIHPIAEKLTVPKKQRRVVDREPITICTPNELRGLLAAAPGWFRPVVAIQAFAGLRCTEILRLDWEDVKLDHGHIEVGNDRGKTGRLAPIPPNLVRWLTYAAKSSGKVFPYSRRNLDEIQAGTATAAEVGWKDNALRHSFISYRVAQTSDVPRVSLETGTSPGKIFKHYRTLVGQMEARQWFIIAP